MDEEVLIEWHSKVSKKYVSKEFSQAIHAKAEPFIKWLKEAEEESSEEEEEESDVEVCQKEYLLCYSVCTNTKIGPRKNTALVLVIKPKNVACGHGYYFVLFSVV